MIDMDVDQIRAKLSMMDDASLQKFAEMHKQDPYLLPLAVAESNRRKQVRAAAQAKQQMPQVKVADANIAQMRPQPAPAPMPPQQLAAGIPQLAARNIEGMADGGIAGYAKGDRIFSADRYLQDPRVQRFLEYINMYEGSPKENQTVGYHSFDDLSKHPNKRVRFNKRGDKSTAAGAYQLINRTWQDQAKKQGLEDFSLDNQKRAAVGVLKETGALDALMNGDIDKAKQRAARAWASIPGSTIGEATGQRAKFNPRAEKILADVSQPTTVAETKKPAPARAAKRQETVGLSPELARQITSALPIGAAQAGELPRDRKTAPAPAAAPRRAPVPTEEAVVDPMGNIISAPPTATGTITGRSPQAGAAAATADYFANLLPFAAGEVAYGGARLLTIPEEEALGARAAAKDFMDPFGRTFGLKEEQGYKQAPTTQLTDFVSKNLDKSAEWLSKNAPGNTLSVNDASNIQNLLLLGLGRGRGKPKEEAGLPGISARQKAAEAEAAAAAERAQTAAAPRLEGPKPETKSGFPVGMEPQKSQVFPISPEAAAFGAEATSRRKLGEQARDVRKAEEAAAAAAKRAEVIRAEETARAADQAGRAQVSTAAKAAIPSAKNIPRAAAATNQAVMPGSYDDIVRAADLGSQDAGFPPTPPSGATPFPTPTSEEKPLAAEQKKAFGLDNEDLLMLGLGMLASPGGQAGGELSQLFSNFGRAGLGAVAAKREREKETGEKAYREAMGKYYEQLAKTQGRPEAKERMIERIAKENNISFTDAAKLLAQIEYDPRYDAMLAVQREKNLGGPMGLLQGGGMDDAGGFTVLGKRAG